MIIPDINTFTRVDSAGEATMDIVARWRTPRAGLLNTVGVKVQVKDGVDPAPELARAFFQLHEIIERKIRGDS